MKERKPRTRRQRQEVRHTRLIEAAERLFVRKGFDLSSVDEISETAGCSPGAFNYHFDSKEQALRAVIEMRRPAAKEALDHLFLRIPESGGRIAAVRRAVFKSVLAMGIPRNEVPHSATRGFGEPAAVRDGESGGRPA
jgi:AcrR family transcriptional regulator